MNEYLFFWLGKKQWNFTVKNVWNLERNRFWLECLVFFMNVTTRHMVIAFSKLSCSNEFNTFFWFPFIHSHGCCQDHLKHTHTAFDCLKLRNLANKKTVDPIKEDWKFQCQVHRIKMKLLEKCAWAYEIRNVIPLIEALLIGFQVLIRFHQSDIIWWIDICRYIIAIELLIMIFVCMFY